MTALQVSRRQRVRRGTTAVGVAALLVTGAAVAAPASAATKVPRMPQVFTKTTAPLPAFVAAAGGATSLTQQTVAGLAGQVYGTTRGLTDDQLAAAQAGFGSSLAYPGTSVPAGTVVASAVGVLAPANTAPESGDAPGCSADTGGSARRVTVTRNGTQYSLQVSGTERGGFVPGPSWQLPTYSTGGPTDVAVLDTTCAYDGPSAIAVTYPSGIDFFAYDGTGAGGFDPAPTGKKLTPTSYWLTTGGATIAATAHVNSDSSYLPVQSEDGGSVSDLNAAMLAVTTDASGSVVLHRIALTSLTAGSGASDVSDSAVPVATVGTAPVTATVAYDNLGQDAPFDAAYALAVRTGGSNSVWFGTIGRGGPTGHTPVAEPGACAGSDLPRLAVANADNSGDDPFTGVVCTVTSGSSTSVQQWSDYVANPADDNNISFPTNPNPPVSRTLPLLTDVTAFVTWPCPLLSDWAQDQGGAPSCGSDMATDLVGTPRRGVAQFGQLPVLDGPGRVVTRPLAGAVAGQAAAVDQLPLARTTLTVKNDSAAAVLDANPPSRPVLFMMPAPKITGLDQRLSGAPVSFGVSSGTGSGQSASISTSTGATVDATLGEPSIAALTLSASAETAVGTSSGGMRTVTSTDTFNDNADEPYVAYLTQPVWQWTGTVVADSTGLGTTNGTKVLTQIAAYGSGNPPRLAANSVSALAEMDPRYRRDGLYGPTLMSVFGPGVYGDAGPTVAGADPGSYPTFVPGGSTVPTQGGAPYCDTATGANGVVTVNSGVPSPFTPADKTVSGGAYLPSDNGYTVETVGDSGSDFHSVSIDDSTSSSYSTTFSVNASAGVTIGGVGATVDAGFSVGNETTVTTSANQTFAAEVGHLIGASASSLPTNLVTAIDGALRQSETFAWQPFICHRTTDLAGGGQTSALVLGFATSGFTGLATIGTTRAPVPTTGSTTASGAPVVAAGSSLAWTRNGPAATYQVRLTPVGAGAARTLTSPVQTPAQSTSGPETVTAALPGNLPAGTYKWQPSAISFNGDVVRGAARYVTVH